MSTRTRAVGTTTSGLRTSRQRNLERSAIELIVEAGRTAALHDGRLFQLEGAKRDQHTAGLLAELESLRSEAATRRRQGSARDAHEVAAAEARLRDVETQTTEVLRADRDEALALAVTYEGEAADARERASHAERECDFLRTEVARMRAGSEQRDPDDADGADTLLAEDIRRKVEARGSVDGALTRSFTLGPVFAVTLEQQGERYRSKAIKACADVVLGTPGLLGHRDDHVLRVGNGGSDPGRVRGRDGAEARRCYIEQRTPAARRLHYWRLPDGSIEFASLNVHDDMAIPE